MQNNSDLIAEAQFINFCFSNASSSLRVTWKPLLTGAYIILARWTIFDKNSEDLEKYLVKLTSQPAENNDFFILGEKELVTEMQKSEFKDKVRPYLNGRLAKFKSENRESVKKIIEEQINFKF